MSSTDPEPHGRHELPQSARPDSAPPPGRSGPLFSVLGLLLCLLLGVAIVTQVRQNDSEDALETARPADLLVLLDSLRQREATLGTEVAELQQTLDALQKSGSSDQAAIENAQARLAALAIMIGTVGAIGPGVVITIDDSARGVAPETMLDVINELRAAGAEAIEVRDGTKAVRIGVDSWVAGASGAVEFDGTVLTPPYSVLAIGDPPTLAAAMNIPGGAVDSVRRLGGAMTVQQADRVEVTVLRQPKPRQYAQPVK
ncbi:hypothetical protein BST33_03875 [Mycolicibacter minnesotensis]|uniref:Uncharacterized protein n=1 Tax=Mycolicibacter minnesotensis TaxID=1118379 RepID=A0A7I7R9Y7_9MYCO|nr:DUF881 domain-containing protein [Mycolicibacter minnesotensis]ORB03101.1 hypothetical protein BST33_03875 [Mycolicibacter minnesotensis]BBY35503.1 hypothetical protein MMIN_35640 [Mycolicibacter minnesotensis]